MDAMDSKTVEDLLNIIRNIESLDHQRKELAEAIKEVYTTAKSSGFDVKAIREVVKLRAMDDKKREIATATLDLYKMAVGLE